MTHKLALISQPHVLPVNNALKKLEWECPVCKGEGKIKVGSSYPMEGIIPSYRDCMRCSRLGKISYTWTPQVGEWVLCLKSNKVHLVSRIFPKYRSCIGVDHIKILQLDAITPILGWEEIVRLVEKATKYSFEVIIPSKRTGRKAQCLIFKPWVRRGIKPNGVIVDERADSTQVAVMKAVRWLKEVK